MNIRTISLLIALFALPLSIMVAGPTAADQPSTSLTWGQKLKHPQQAWRQWRQSKKQPKTGEIVSAQPIDFEPITAQPSRSLLEMAQKEKSSTSELPAWFYHIGTRIASWTGFVAFLLLWSRAQHNHSQLGAQSYLPRAKRMELQKLLTLVQQDDEKRQIVLKELEIMQRQINELDKQRQGADLRRWILGLSAAATLVFAALPWFVPRDDN